MKPKIKMSDLFKWDVGNSHKIFHYLQSYDASLTTPILSDFIDLTNAVVLDFDYELGFSAEKYVSPLFYNRIVVACDYLDIPFSSIIDGTITLTDLQNLLDDMFDDVNGGYYLTAMIHQRFAVKWKKIYDALMTNYKPLENYDMEEKETPDITNTRSINTDLTEERKVNTDLTTSTENDITDSDIYGFNSGNPNPSGKITRNGDVVVTGDADDNVETTHTTGDADDNVITDKESGTRTLERHGNIGVTTSQQMLQSEFEVRKYDFYKMIYSDIDSILCLKTY